MARKRRSKEEIRKVDALIERLREFVRLNYMTAAEVAREIGVNDSTVYSWLLGRSRPTKPKRTRDLSRFFSATEWIRHRSGRLQYREYKNWRGIPKPRRCPFCKKAKGEIRRKGTGFLGVCPNCGARGPKRESHGEALMAWNGKGIRAI